MRSHVETAVSDEDNDDVPWVMVNEEDGNNMIYALIKTNGDVVLSLVKNGQKTTWNNQSSLDPFDEHAVDVSIVGENAKVWVDGTMYIDEDHADFDNISGYAGLYTHDSTGHFNSVAVLDVHRTN